MLCISVLGNQLVAGSIPATRIYAASFTSLTSFAFQSELVSFPSIECRRRLQMLPSKRPCALTDRRAHANTDTCTISPPTLFLRYQGDPFMLQNLCVSLSCRRDAIATHIPAMIKSLETQSKSGDINAYPASLEAATKSAGKLFCHLLPIGRCHTVPIQRYSSC